MPSAKQVNTALIKALTTHRQVKEAQNAINSFIKGKLQEDGFMRRILSPVPFDLQTCVPFVGMPKLSKAQRAKITKALNRAASRRSQ